MQIKQCILESTCDQMLTSVQGPHKAAVTIQVCKIMHLHVQIAKMTSYVMQWNFSLQGKIIADMPLTIYAKQ